jgi:uncharacterized protein YndB with AHSA1/START domain
VRAAKLVAGVLALAALIVLALALRKPATFHVERRVVVAAPAAKVFPYLEDPRKTLEWSPWEKKDPAIKKSFSGAAKGVGAVYAWEGNKEVGSGVLTITAVEPDKSVAMDLDFKTPMEGHSVATYALSPAAAGGTEVSWSIEGPNSFVSKVMCVFMDMDKMIGGEFEKGLAELKRVVEAR